MAMSLFDVARHLRNEARIHRRAAATLEELADRAEKVISAAVETNPDMDYQAIVQAVRTAIAPHGDDDDD